jgi:hypothetical protein
MKKFILSASVVAAMFAASNAKAQLIDEQNVTVTMDLQPILQLGLNGSQNIDFVFDQIAEYVGGITQYGATSLNVSSTVSWDLYAAGFSSAAASGGAATDLIWDNQVSYGIATDNNAVTTLPLTLLELHQDKPNPSLSGTSGASGIDDYNTPFQTGTTSLGANNVYVTSAPYLAPADGSKYIAGDAGTANFVAGGTYLVAQNTSVVGAASNYYYSIDYRIVPGLPATFPRATDPTADGGNTTAQTNTFAGSTATYARPGVYTMNVKYVLIENN